MAGAVSRTDAAEVTVEAIGKAVRALVESSMSRETDRRAIDFVIGLCEESAALVIEAAQAGKIVTKRSLILALAERTRKIVTFAAADVDLIQCFSAVVDLVITTAGSMRNTVLIAKVTGTAATGSAAVPVVSALIALSGTTLTIGIACAAVFEIVAGFLESLDKCGPLLKADPRGQAALGRLQMTDGFHSQILVVA